MATFEYNTSEQLIVKSNNREFIFNLLTDSGSVEFVFARTVYRKSAEVTDQYACEDDFPTDVVECVRSEGYDTIKFSD
jgi:hypothetical protein